jgi:hypothetical protein
VWIRARSFRTCVPLLKILTETLPNLPDYWQTKVGG